MKTWFKNSWFYWWFFTSRKCKQNPSEWFKKDCGMGRFKCCTVCGKVLII